jgi:hypothetical protein
VQTGESYLGCHIHVNTLVSRRNQPEAGGCILDLCQVYWQQNKKKARAEGNSCHASNYVETGKAHTACMKDTPHVPHGTDFFSPFFYPCVPCSGVSVAAPSTQSAHSAASSQGVEYEDNEHEWDGVFKC